MTSAMAMRIDECELVPKPLTLECCTRRERGQAISWLTRRTKNNNNNSRHLGECGAARACRRIRPHALPSRGVPCSGRRAANPPLYLAREPLAVAAAERTPSWHRTTRAVWNDDSTTIWARFSHVRSSTMSSALRGEHHLPPDTRSSLRDATFAARWPAQSHDPVRVPAP